jgi:hypothetical protein
MSRHHEPRESLGWALGRLILDLVLEVAFMWI